MTKHECKADVSNKHNYIFRFSISGARLSCVRLATGFFRNYFADNWGDAMRMAAPSTVGGTNFMMVVRYWEQAFALLNCGLLHDDLFFETSGEFFGVSDRIKPTIAEGREQWANKQFLGNMEQPAQRYEGWIEKRSPGHLAKMREFMKQMRPQSPKAA